MVRIEFAVWIVAIVAFLCLATWAGVLLMRWARRGSKGAALFGLGMGLPAAFLNANPQPPKEIQLEEVRGQIHRRNDSESGDPET